MADTKSPAAKWFSPSVRLDLSSAWERERERQRETQRDTETGRGRERGCRVNGKCVTRTKSSLKITGKG